MKRTPRTHGFTIIELLIAMVIIGVLAAIAIPKFDFSKKRGYRSALQSDLRNLITKQEMYHGDSLTYTTNTLAFPDLQSTGTTIYINFADTRGWGATAAHAGLPGEHCGVYFGTAAASTGDPATTPGTPECQN